MKGDLTMFYTTSSKTMTHFGIFTTVLFVMLTIWGCDHAVESPTAESVETPELVEMKSDAAIPAAPALNKPDLVVLIQSLLGPITAKPGDDVGPRLRLVARNIGRVAAPGTIGILDPANGYMIDLVLSTDGNIPAGFAMYSPNFAEDVLLKGGRVSRTVDLAPGGAAAYRVGAMIPVDTPPGNYFIGARIDPGSRVAESNENNNTAVWPIVIQGGN
jgi:hypothetical protein